MNYSISEKEKCRFCNGHYTNTDLCLYLAHKEIDKFEEVLRELYNAEWMVENSYRSREPILIKVAKLLGEKRN